MENAGEYSAAAWALLRAWHTLLAEGPMWLGSSCPASPVGARQHGASQAKVLTNVWWRELLRVIHSGQRPQHWGLQFTLTDSIILNVTPHLTILTEHWGAQRALCLPLLNWLVTSFWQHCHSTSPSPRPVANSQPPALHSLSKEHFYRSISHLSFRLTRDVSTRDGECTEHT